ncbi:DUF6232 family protein [Hamadaea tsunoensis]|uniref:DUF6232 family protein n=1 Tax=Hamadaea tsunoensis TaxID=53368 RepID=UPI0004088040|nr:DUF6232 family protein [Hamadaea tsunoensis]
MITYYKDPQVQVTSETLRVGDVRIPLDRLQYVWHTSAEAPPKVRLRLVGRGAVGFGFVIGGLLALIGIVYLLALVIGDAATAGRVLLPLAGVVALVGLAGPLVEMGMHRIDRNVDQGSQVREIWSVVDGQERCLIRIADAQRFGRIYRALERAIEAAGAPAPVVDGSDDGT